MKKIGYILLLGILVLGTGILFFRKGKAEGGQEITATVKAGKFEVFVLSTGELKAKNQIEVTAPGSQLREAGIFSELKIEDLIQEGTLVKKGEYVASIEKNPIMSKLGDAALEVDKKTSEFNQARLDTTLTLRESRDELYNLKIGVEQAKLELEQSRFEAPATIRQKEIELEKASKTFKQKTENYFTKIKQAATKVQIIQSDLSLALAKEKRLRELMGKLTINAPEDGMLIYTRNWNGNKKIVGSTVNPWDATVATLPDLTKMQIVTYINEVDIQKIKVGQYVEIGLDAEPGKKLEGGVAQVANVGEQKPNSDAKVFEVLIDVITKDPSLRPAMTTSCKIHAGQFENVLHAPLEAIHNDKNKTFVFKKNGTGWIRQLIKVGAVNEQEAILYGALEKGDEVLLTSPSDTSNLNWAAIKPAAAEPKAVEDQAWKKRWEKFKKETEKPNVTRTTEAPAL